MASGDTEDWADGEDADDVAADMTAAIERELAELPPEARRSLQRHLGPADVIAYGIAEARPLERRDGTRRAE